MVWPLPARVNTEGSGSEVRRREQPRPATSLIDIGSLPPESMAPLACSGLTVYSAMKKLGPVIHEAAVVVIGAGGLGLMCIAVLRALGARGAVVVDIDPHKLAAATAAGALAVVDSSKQDTGGHVAQRREQRV